MACSHGYRWALWLAPETHIDTTYNRCPSLHSESLVPSILSPHPPHLTIFPVTSLVPNYSPFHPCFELGLNEPCFVFLLLTYTQCSNDSGSSPKLTPWVRHSLTPTPWFNSSIQLTVHRRGRPKQRVNRFSCHGCHNGESLGFLTWEIFPWSSFQLLLQQLSDFVRSYL